MDCDDSHHYLVGQIGYKSGLTWIVQWIFPTKKECVNCGKIVTVDSWFDK